jgi:DNA invertase Pin-like site-specific DNA recombinase
MASRILQQQPRAALYVRVSTTNGQDPTLQTRELREYCERRGWSITSEYADIGVSGAKEKRPELNKLITDEHRRRFDVVLVWKLDRFGRSLRHLVNSLAELESLGIDFVSLRDNLDLTTPSGRLMFQITGAMAEFERALIQERVKAGMRNARAKGRRIGRPPQTPLSPELRENIADAYAHGATSLRALAKQFGTSLATIQRCIGVRRSAASESHYPLNS